MSTTHRSNTTMFEVAWTPQGCVGPMFRFLAAVRITHCHNSEGIWETLVNQEDSCQ
jgi:hypothetical protein